MLLKKHKFQDAQQSFNQKFQKVQESSQMQIDRKLLRESSNKFDQKFKFKEEKILHLPKKSEVCLRISSSETQNSPVKIEASKFHGKQAVWSYYFGTSSSRWWFGNFNTLTGSGQQSYRNILTVTNIYKFTGCSWTIRCKCLVKYYKNWCRSSRNIDISYYTKRVSWHFDSTNVQQWNKGYWDPTSPMVVPS